jgi:hypothetical protein
MCYIFLNLDNIKFVPLPRENTDTEDADNVGTAN